MANHRIQDAYLADLQTAHRELSQQHQRIEQLLDEGLQRGWTDAVIGPVTQRLSELCEAAGRHFAQEEAGGHLEEAVTRLPRLHGEMHRLLADHRGLLEQLRQISQLAASLVGSRSAWPRLSERIVAVLSRLKEHERAETNLVEQGFNVSLEDRL